MDNRNPRPDFEYADRQARLNVYEEQYFHGHGDIASDEEVRRIAEINQAQQKQVADKTQ